MNKCVFVIGPESSGSMLIARVCSHVLDIHFFGTWNGAAWSDKGNHKVCHRSLPYGYPPQYPNISEWVAENENDYEISFVLTTRDITISEVSRFERWSKPLELSMKESEHAKGMMNEVLAGPHPCFVWSYETFMYLQAPYLQRLYQFLGVESDFMPVVKDANKNKIADPVSRTSQSPQ